MEIFSDETELTDIHMFQRFVGMFEGRPRLERIVRIGLLGMEYDDELDDTGEDDYESQNWPHGYNNLHRYPRFSDISSDRGFRGNHTRSSSSNYQPPLHYYTSADLPRPPSVKVQAKESDTERRARLLQETKKGKEKAEKKRLKKQKQKEKRREKMEKEEQTPSKNEEGTKEAEQSKAAESKPVNDKSKDDTNSSVKQLASAKDTDSSDDESSDEDSETKNDSCDSEELDMTSTFVTKAALIAKRKLEQKPRPERKEKKIPVKEHKKTVPDKPHEDPEGEKKDSATPTIPSIEDNIKISTELAVIGNRFASSGDFNMAVKYFTDAIKYNPKEFKLFGNRSFCFEKMQEYEKALTDAELCLNMCPGWVKGLFRKGRALAGLKRYEEASQAFRDVLKLDGSYAEAAQELMRVQITHLMVCNSNMYDFVVTIMAHGAEVLSGIQCTSSAAPVCAAFDDVTSTIRRANQPVSAGGR